jgi:hypothetical protein
MARYIFIINDKDGKQVKDGVRGNLVEITDDKAAIAFNGPILTEKPAVTDYAPAIK